MTTHRTHPLPALTLGLVALLAAATAGSLAAATPDAVFERFKALEGEWVAAADGEMAKKGELVSIYRVTAAGSAVVETHFPGSAHEMVTVYYPQGDDLVLVHYCIEGNQPRMRASDLDGSKIRFAFDGGGNIDDPAKDRHMHSAWIEFVGPDEIRSEWTELADGEAVLVVPSHLVRKESR